MNDIIPLIDCLEKTPLILHSFIGYIPVHLLKKHRIRNKWSIHEHACHLARAESMIIQRFEDFKNQQRPRFEPYLPGRTGAPVDLLKLDLSEELENFKFLRKSLIELVRAFEATTWQRKADHSEYLQYSAPILLRHTLMHDHFHMYRIEELWLTRDQYLNRS